MTHTVIRFPVAAKLGDKRRIPNATPVSLMARLKRWLFGYARPVNLASLRMDRARKGR